MSLDLIVKLAPVVGGLAALLAAVLNVRQSGVARTLQRREKQLKRALQECYEFATFEEWLMRNPHRIPQEGSEHMPALKRGVRGAYRQDAGSKLSVKSRQDYQKALDLLQ